MVDVALGGSTILLPPRFEFLHGTRHVLLFSVYAPLSGVRPGSVPASDRNPVGGIHHVADPEYPNGGQCFEVERAVVGIVRVGIAAIAVVVCPPARKNVIHDAPHEMRLAGKRHHRHLQAVGQGGSYQMGVNGANVREELLERTLPATTGVNVKDGLVEIQRQEIYSDVVPEVFDDPLDAGGVAVGQRRRRDNAASSFCRGGGRHDVTVVVVEILIAATAAGHPLFHSSVVVVVLAVVVNNSNKVK